MNDIDELQERKDRETDKALTKTKSVSFNDLIKISGVLRIIVSSTLVAFNEQSCRILYKQAMTNMEGKLASKLFSAELTGSIGILTIGVISSTEYF